MKVTRDVVYDLLPTYFAGEASEDTRALIEEFFARDPELGHKAKRFRTLMAERLCAGGAPIEADRAKIVFDRARPRIKLRVAAAVWALGSVFPLGMAVFMGMDGHFSLRHPGAVIGAVFGAMALFTWLMSLSPHPEARYAAFSGSDERTAK